LKLSKGVLYSIAAHAALVLSMIIQVVFYPSEALDLSRAIRVDMIDLPDKLTSQPIPEDNSKLPEKKTAEPVAEPEEKKPEPAVETKPEPKVTKEEPKPKLPDKKEKPAEEAININKVKSKQKDALNKLKAAAAIEKLKEEESKKAEAKSKQVFKGRVLSAGTSITGLDKLQSDSYLSQLDGRIKSHWALPQWLIGKPLRARVHIKFDENGNILFKKITQSSGNQTYDEYCLLAIDKATPLPKVPEKFSTVYKVDGVVIGFPD
jgi:colicin import membrane protein